MAKVKKSILCEDEKLPVFKLAKTDCWELFLEYKVLKVLRTLRCNNYVMLSKVFFVHN